MSEDPATYYTPQARFIQSTDRVWMLLPPDAPLADMGETVGQIVCISQDHGVEHVSFRAGIPVEEMAGREMVLTPVETLAAVETKLDALIAWIERSSTSLPSVPPDRIYTHSIVELVRIKAELFGSEGPDPDDF